MKITELKSTGLEPHNFELSCSDVNLLVAPKHKSRINVREAIQKAFGNFIAGAAPTQTATINLTLDDGSCHQAVWKSGGYRNVDCLFEDDGDNPDELGEYKIATVNLLLTRMVCDNPDTWLHKHFMPLFSPRGDCCLLVEELKRRLGEINHEPAVICEAAIDAIAQDITQTFNEHGNAHKALMSLCMNIFDDMQTQDKHGDWLNDQIIARSMELPICRDVSYELATARERLATLIDQASPDIFKANKEVAELERVNALFLERQRLQAEIINLELRLNEHRCRQNVKLAACKIFAEERDALVEATLGKFLATANRFLDGLINSPLDFKRGVLGRVATERDWTSEVTVGSWLQIYAQSTLTEQALFKTALAIALCQALPAKIVMADMSLAEPDSKPPLILRLNEFIRDGTIHQAFIIDITAEDYLPLSGNQWFKAININ